MKKWNGQYVTDTLNIPTPNAVGFRQLLGLALRKNPKRAHLLVSTVLGKHIPQKPVIVSAAAEALAHQILELHRNPNVNKTTLRRAARQKVLNLLAGNIQAGYMFDNPARYQKTPTTVFGYAETATGLGASVAEFLNADYIHSTRYPDLNTTPYGFFEEEHSHATAHHITPKNPEILDDPNRVIVLVDDELSTGNTIMNTIRMFETRTHHPVYYVATLTDLRTGEATRTFEQFEQDNNVEVRVVSLVSAQLKVPENALMVAEPVLNTLKTLPEPEQNQHGTTYTRTYPRNIHHLKNGVTGKTLLETQKVAETIADASTPHFTGKTLVLGIEEDMYLPLLVARFLEEKHHQNVRFSSTTRSPVVTFNNPEYAVRTRVVYRDGGQKRYAYNIPAGKYDRVIILSHSPENTKELSDLITQLRKRANIVEVLEAKVDVNRLAEPLTGPTFGSYPTEDVSWLLKDLSTVQLEAPTEDREEAIQSGGAHYAESLPVEYIPSAEYQKLFTQALADNADRLAEAVAFVSEQVFRKRKGTPVLVSLARAGVPVGVLMRRYLNKAYHVDIPHYAVSIVRGKGIDYNALRYIAAHHPPEDVVFVDGWTGKGAITEELKTAVEKFHTDTSIRFNPELAVLADPGNCVTVYGTREDYLIPSACLNSTVSGLVSRTVLNTDHINETDYHGAKFYTEFAAEDVTNLFVDTITEHFTETLIHKVRETTQTYTPTVPDWSGWAAVERLSEEYTINNVNLVKPGVGETTRVLLRRVPWRILIKPSEAANLTHVLLLAAQRGVEVEEREDIPYACVGLIHPNYTKGATGFDGGKIS